jgi:hypothetical protein
LIALTNVPLELDKRCECWYGDCYISIYSVSNIVRILSIKKMAMVQIFYVVMTKLAGNSINVMFNDTGMVSVVKLYEKSLCSSCRIQNVWKPCVFWYWLHLSILVQY